MTIEQIYLLFKKNSIVDTDSRNIRNGSIFFALKGENFDGNKYCEEALNKGANYAVIDDKKYAHITNTILVDNVLKSLQELATFHRRQINIPIIGITGSNGKTTTKELIQNVLSTTYKTSTTHGNLNNHIGVPLTLLKMASETEIGIVEMGANHQKEIEKLCEIAEPNYGVITNFGKAHLEGFGGVEGVIKGKSELYQFIRNSNGTVFINLDDKIQVEKSEGIKTVGYSREIVQLNSLKPFVSVRFKSEKIDSHLLGEYNYNNIANAIIIGDFFNVSIENIKKGIANYIPQNNRSQILTKNSNTIILDAYNANPSSMTVAIENFKIYEAATKIVILGDMFELGEYSLFEHTKIAELASEEYFQKAILIGENFSKVDIKNVEKFKTFEEFTTYFSTKKFENTAFLIKGSRGMTMERVLDLL